MQAIPDRDGFILPIFNGTPTFLHAAEHCLALGYSVIPLYGDVDSGRAKVPATAWAAFQQRKPTRGELQRWFVEQRYAGLGIVTGSISSLMVLDFDSTDLYQTFLCQIRLLAQTYTVQTRRGYHLYFKLPAYLTIPSRKGQGLDLLSDGRYVVAPPTVINGHTYEVVSDVQPYPLTEAEITRIQAFFEALAAVTPEIPQTPHFPASVRVSEGTVEIASASSSRFLTTYDLQALYQYLAPQHGRNEALFRASIRGRDDAWTQRDVIGCLADLHAQQEPGSAHRPETNQQRYREAVCTIRSAFSRPARPRPVSHALNPQQLPNRVREALLQLKQTYTLRVIEALRLSGILPGQPFTAREAVQRLKGLVGRDSVYHALQATTPDGEPIFAVNNPSPRTLTLATADRAKDTTPLKECFLGSEQKSGKRCFHRPARVFTMPGNLELCRKLGVKPSRSDPLTSADLGSAKTTRQALHREFIKRRPGLYPRRWLAQRLGTCVRTLHAYNRAIPIQVIPMYLDTLITWSSLHAIPEFEVPGTFLQDETGKRYPAKAGIARHLLSKGQRVLLRRRDCNYYYYGDRPPDIGLLYGCHPTWEAKQQQISEFVRQHEGQAQEHFEARLDALMHKLAALPDALPQTAEPRALPQASTPAAAPPVCLAEDVSQPAAAKPVSKRYFRRPLADERQERLAQRLHEQTNPCGLSLSNARRLVQTYGTVPVEAALKRMRELREKGKIENAAGFLVVAARTEWRKQHGATELGSWAPRFRGEPQRKGRNTYRGPLSDPLCRSERWLAWRAAFALEQTGDWLEAAYWRSKFKREIQF